MRKQIPANIKQYLLCRLDHRLCITIGGECPYSINRRCQYHPTEQCIHFSRYKVIDHRAYHIRSQQIRQGADGYQNRHHQENQFVPPHIGQQHADRIAEIFRLFGTELLRRHIPLPLSFEIDKFPDRLDRFPIAPGGFQ